MPKVRLFVASSESRGHPIRGGTCHPCAFRNDHFVAAICSPSGWGGVKASKSHSVTAFECEVGALLKFLNLLALITSECGNSSTSGTNETPY